MHLRVPLTWFILALTLAAAIECKTNRLKKPRNSRRQNEDEHKAPVFTRTGPPIRVLQQDVDLHLKCKVQGNPKPQITWFYNGQDMFDPPQQFHQRIEIGQFSLLVKALKVADSGNYTCVAGNLLGSIQHQFEVRVQQQQLPKSPPLILSNPRNHTVKMGDNISLKCKVMDMSASIPHIQWVKHFQVNGSWIDKGPVKESYYFTLVQDGAEAKNPELFTLTNVTKEDEGRYTCIVSNAYGKVSQSKWLKVEPESEFPMEGGVFQSKVLNLLAEIRDHLLGE